MNEAQRKRFDNALEAAGFTDPDINDILTAIERARFTILDSEEERKLRENTINLMAVEGQLDALVRIEAAAKEVCQGPEGCITTPPCGDCIWCRLYKALKDRDRADVPF